MFPLFLKLLQKLTMTDRRTGRGTEKATYSGSSSALLKKDLGTKRFLVKMIFGLKEVLSKKRLLQQN